MTNEAIGAAARAMCEASPFDDDKPSDYNEYAQLGEHSMNHHNIQLIQFGEKQGYAKAVKDIVAWLRDATNDTARLAVLYTAASQIEAKFGKANDC